MTDGCGEPHEKDLFYEKFVIVIRQVCLLLMSEFCLRRNKL